MAIPVDKDLLAIGNKLNDKLLGLDLAKLNLSPSGRDYFQYNVKKLNYVQQLNVKILQELIQALDKPRNNLTIIDHGGGLGFWSFLLKEAGIGTVIYHDINKNYLHDLQKLGEKLGYTPDHICMGDSGALVQYCRENQLIIDGLGSRNVIEHVPDLNYFFANLAEIPSDHFVAVISTSANTHNPLVRWQHMRLHRKYESVGSRTSKVNGGYQGMGALEKRAQKIKERIPNLEDNEVLRLATMTRGYGGESLEQAIRAYSSDQHLPTAIPHPTNTCDPETGAWVERLVSYKEYLALAEQVGFEFSLVPGFYNQEYNGFLKRFIASTLNSAIPRFPNLQKHMSPYLMFSLKKRKAVLK